MISQEEELEIKVWDAEIAYWNDLISKEKVDELKEKYPNSYLIVKRNKDNHPQFVEEEII